MTEPNEEPRLGVHYDKVREANHQKLDTGFVAGKKIGFKCLDDLYSVRLKGTTYIHGAPFSGKSELWFEFQINLSIQYQWKHVLYTPETGDVDEVYEHIIEMLSSCDFYSLTHDHLTKVEDWVKDHFFVIDPGIHDVDIFWLYRELDRVKQEWGEFHTFTIDPYNELVTSYGREPRDEVLSKILSRVRKESRIRNIHTCVIFHDQDIPMKKWKDKVDGEDFWYYPPATMQQMSGGQTPSRKGEMVICVWRPPLAIDFTDEHGFPTGKNVTRVIIQKFKPKRYGQRGSVYLFYNVAKARYYEKIGTQECYAWEHIDYLPNGQRRLY